MKAWLTITEDDARLIVKHLDTKDISGIDERIKTFEVKLMLMQELGKIEARRITYKARQEVTANV